MKFVHFIACRLASSAQIIQDPTADFKAAVCWQFCPKSRDTFPRNFPIDGEVTGTVTSPYQVGDFPLHVAIDGKVANLLWTGVMDFGLL